MALGRYPHNSLGVVVEMHLGPIPKDMLYNDLRGRTRGIANWYRFNCCLIDQEQRADFISLLSDQQKASFCLLYDWWTASYSDAAGSLASTLHIINRCSDLEGLGFSAEKWRSLFSHLQLKRWPTGHINVGAVPDPYKLGDPEEKPEVEKRIEEEQEEVWSINAIDFTTYDASLRSLYFEEFESLENYLHPHIGENPSQLFLDDDRREASVKAWCQRAAYCCFQYLLRDTTSVDSDAHMPSESAKLTSDSNTIAMLRPSDAYAPPVRGCPWLKQNISNPRATLPYYLWDRNMMRTVRVDNLTSVPKYTAISHTWGRWLKQNRISIRLQDVPWPIPENTRFEVKDLGRLLSMVPTSSPYVWFDLVCIPQDGSPIAQREIARQAEIFQGAEHAVAWLNDITNFDCLTNALQWLLMRTPMCPEDSPECKSRDQILHRTLDSLQARPSNLLQPRNNRLDSTNNDLNSWFTSLWTLQELCLRPDMWLCSRDWKPLTIDGTTPLPVSGIVTIMEAQGLFGLDRDFPFDDEGQVNIALWELDLWRFETGLHRLLDFTRADIIAWGDRRECTSRRAEAIMAALGVIDWYKSGDPNTRENDLILGKYPAAFIQELVAQDPGEFFGSFSKITHRDRDERGDRIYVGDEWDNEDSEMDDEEMYRSPTSPSKIPNTILPFSVSGAAYIDARGGQHHGNTPHECLLTWHICTSGEVQMPEACILASSREDLQPQLDFGMEAMLIGLRSRNAPTISGQMIDTKDLRTEDAEYENKIDLQEWVRTRTYEAHAVALSEIFMSKFNGQFTLRKVYGFILRRLDENHLVKIGHFEVIDDQGELTLPKPSRVDWLVC